MDTVYIMVFGSNEAGRHGKGAARDASRMWGAIYRVGSGPQGRAFGIPTKDKDLRPLSLPLIAVSVKAFLVYATAHPENTYLVTRIGCGLGGKTNEEMAPMFIGAPANCFFDPEWAAWGLKSWIRSPNEIAAAQKKRQLSLF